MKNSLPSGEMKLFKKNFICQRDKKIFSLYIQAVVFSALTEVEILGMIKKPFT